MFQHTKLYLSFFKISASALFLKKFLKFRKFQPGYSYKMYSYIKKEYRTAPALCHRMCKVTKETSGASKIRRNAIDLTSITLRWTSSRSRQPVFPRLWTGLNDRQMAKTYLG